MTLGFGYTAAAFTDNRALAAFTNVPADDDDDPLINLPPLERVYNGDLARPDLALVVAMELSAVTAADIGNSGTFYLATESFTTLPANSPASTFFDGRLQSCVLTRSIERGNDGQLAGGLIRAFGEVELSNADGGLDDLLSLWYVEGRAVVIKVAAKVNRNTVRGYNTFSTVFTGTAGQWTFERGGDSVRLRLESVNRQLRREIGTTAYTGTGGANGTSDLEDVSKPQTYGICYNVSPQLIDPTIRTYQVHDDFIEDIAAVYDSGIPLEFAGRYADYATLSVQELDPGTYAISRTEGHIMLGADPVGQVTVDVTGDRTANRRPLVERWQDGTVFGDGQGWTADTRYKPVKGAVQAIWRILEERASFTASQINVDNFYRADVLQPAQIGYHIPPGDAGTIEQHTAELARSIGACIGPDQFNRLVIVRVDSPSDNSPHDLTKANIVGLERATLPYGAPWYQWRLGYRINWTPQSETQLAATVSLARKGQLKKQYPVTVNSETDVLTAYPSARAIEDKTYFVEVADAQAERTRREALYAVGRIMLSVTVKTFMFRIELGETVKVTYDRFNLDSGRFFTVLEVEEDLVDQTTRLLLFG